MENSNEDGKWSFLCNLWKADICLNNMGRGWVGSAHKSQKVGDLNRKKNSGYWVANQSTAVQTSLK